MSDSLFKAIALAAQGEKLHGITVIAVSHTAGSPDNSVMFTEYAADASEYVYKQQIIWDHVLAGLNGDNSEGTGGALRGMGEDFQQALDDAGGNLEQVVAAAPELWRKAGQGRKAEKAKK